MTENSLQLHQSELMTVFVFPWIFMVLAAAWFGWMAHGRNRSIFLWAVAGALLGLLATTFAEGLAHATAVPYSEAQRAAHRFYALISSGVLIAGVGLLLHFYLRPGIAPASTATSPVTTP